MSENTEKSTYTWKHPLEVMQLQKLKRKKKALAARINSTNNASTSLSNTSEDNETFNSKKRKNPFVKNNENKRSKCLETEDLSEDQTLFKLFNINNKESQTKDSFKQKTTFENILEIKDEPVVVKSKGESWVPIDFSLKRKVRFLSQKPLNWNAKLKISEEASGVTSFARCLDTNTLTTLDTSSNSKFHQCCLYWQHPSIPWLSLFPRSTSKAPSTIPLTAHIKDSLHKAWVDSISSVFHLIRTRQCPYFYVCANSFTVVFRAAGISGFAEINAMVSPTTRGFRQMLKQEEIEFSMPLRCQHSSQTTGQEVDEEGDDEEADEQWLKSMGINSDDIKKINYTQEKITRNAESEVDNSRQSLVLIQGVEVQAFFSFLLNCKSTVSQVGLFAGIPPTLLAPVAFHGATLMTLNVREAKVLQDSEVFYSIDLTGPLLPQTIHNLCLLHSKENSMIATFSTLQDSESFSNVFAKKSSTVSSESGVDVFNKENLSDCGLRPEVLEHFCLNNENMICNVECLKYSAENQQYVWT